MANTKTNYRSAVGLNYLEGQNSAPEVSIKGKLKVADEIVAIAKRFGVPVVDRPELAKTLSALRVDQQIPPDLYEAVAVLLTEISFKKKRL